MIGFAPRHSLRAALSAAALALFVAGSNLCLVAGLAASRGVVVPMGCTSMVPGRAGTPAMSPCGHPIPAKQDRRPAPGPAPCCFSLLPVSAPSLAHHPGLAAPALAPVAILIAAPEPPAPGQLLGHEPHAPPGALLRAPAPSRAPPLL